MCQDELKVPSTQQRCFVELLCDVLVSVRSYIQGFSGSNPVMSSDSRLDTFKNNSDKRKKCCELICLF